MTSKTPASIIEELSVIRRCGVPVYTLRTDHTIQGTHLNTFVYQLDAMSHTTVGSGPSKKIARQDAAQKLLNLLKHGEYQAPAKVEENICSSSSKLVQAELENLVNYRVNLLQMCNVAGNGLMPQYKEIAQVGPPHLIQFTYECVIGSVKTRGTATTKKQALQMAAKNMIDRLVFKSY